jgi:hypothetical protein
MDGTASLANREIGRVLPANYPKVPFSGAAKHLNRSRDRALFRPAEQRIPRRGLVGGGSEFELTVPVSKLALPSERAVYPLFPRPHYLILAPAPPSGL